MVNLFRFADNDQSLVYLSKIFGYMNGVIPRVTGSGVTESGTSIALLGSMFQTFNGIILVVGALIIVYTTIVGVLATAAEGEFMGKKWNNIWIPIRTVIGIAALVPTGSGYSGIQIIMMWVIVQGIGAADVLWTTALSHVDLLGAPNASVTVPSANTQQAINELFKGLVCDSTARITSQDPSQIGGNYFCASGDRSFCGPPPAFSPGEGDTTFLLGPGANGACGKLTFCNQTTSCATNSDDPDNSGPNSVKCLACQGQRAALRTIIPTLRAVADRFANADYQYRDFYANSAKNPNNSSWQWIKPFCASKGLGGRDQCCVPYEGAGADSPCKAPSREPFPSTVGPDGSIQSPSNAAVRDLYWPYAIAQDFGSGDFIRLAVIEYQEQLTRVITEFIATQGNRTLSEDLEEAKRPGWIMAGSYYYTVANANSKKLGSAIPPLLMEVRDPNAGDNLMSTYRNNLSAASVLTYAASGGSSSAFEALPAASGLGSAAGASFQNIQDAFNQNLSNDGGGNPLLDLAITGSVFLTVAEALFIIVMAITLTVGLSGNLSFFVLGTGAINPLGGTVTLFYIVLMPLMMGLFGFLISIGGMLGIYVPMIPYIIFTFGAIGWLISTIEAMVAGPLVALGILSPSGQHEIMGKSGPALMLLLNIFLRPSLMIFGLIAAMLLATVVVTMINAAFYTVMTGIGTGSLIIAWIFWLTLYVTLIVAALNKAFAAIHIIPEKVMRWIEGGHGEQYGEGEVLGEAKHGAQAAAAGTKAGGGEIHGATKKGTEGKRASDEHEGGKKTPKIT